MGKEIDDMDLDELKKLVEIEEDDVPDNNEEEIDVNNISLDDLQAMTDGKDVDENKGEENTEASEEELLEMLDDGSISFDELDSVKKQKNEENVSKIDDKKLRMLSNKIELEAPLKLFEKKKDDIFYYFSCLTGKSKRSDMEQAREKCLFINSQLKKLETYMMAEAGFTIDECQSLMAINDAYAQEYVEKSEDKIRVKEQYRQGWEQKLVLLARETRQIRELANSPKKTMTIILKFYEALKKSYDMVRAQDSMKHIEDVGVDIAAEQKKKIITCFDDLIEVAPSYGLKSLNALSRKDLYKQVEETGLDGIIDMIKDRIKNRFKN